MAANVGFVRTKKRTMSEASAVKYEQEIRMCLHEIFEVPYPEIARALDIQASTRRKLVSRARA